MAQQKKDGNSDHRGMTLDQLTALPQVTQATAGTYAFPTARYSEACTSYEEAGVAAFSGRRSDRLDSWARRSSLVAALKECGQSRDLERAKIVHLQARAGGFSAIIHIANTLISMYGKCGSMSNARSVFDNMPQRDVVTWTVLLQGYVENGQCEFALELFDGMQKGGCNPDSRTYVAALTAIATLAARSKENTGKICSDLVEKGKTIHSKAVKEKCCNIFVESILVDVYAKCYCMVDARSVFDKMINRNVVSWTALIQGYVDNGESELALQIFDDMLIDGCIPNSRTYLAVLAACAALASSRDGEDRKWLKKGQEIHSRAVIGGCSNTYVENMLVNLFTQCGELVEARRVFDKMNQLNVVSWNCLMQGFVDNGESEAALELFDGMGNSGFSADARTFVAALTACASLAAKSNKGTVSRWMERGKAIHSRATLNQCCNIFVENKLIKLYASCSDMDLARGVFDKMIHRTVVTWNCLLQGYVDNEESEEALDLFQLMREEGFCVPDARTYVAALTACATLAAKDDRHGNLWLETGKNIHSMAAINQCCDGFVENSLVSMYAQCGTMFMAQNVFDNMVTCDVISWTALLHGYVQDDQNALALELFEDIEKPDARTYAVAIKACVNLAGKCSDNAEVWIGKARDLYWRAKKDGCCDTFVWNCLIRGYVESEENELALEMIARMNEEDVTPNSATFVSALMACGNLMALENGEAFHEQIRKLGCEEDAVVATCLVDFYGKCGSMEIAKQVFDSISRKDIWTWNALMSGYSQQGDAFRVFQAFHLMKGQGTAPDEVTFTLVLTVCSHVGLTNQGRKYFDAMQIKYGITPNSIHYTCIVDLLARANQFAEALKVVKALPFKAHNVIWTAILSACRKWNNVEVGKMAYQCLVELDEKEDVAYVLMANIFSGAGMKEEYELVVASRKRILAREFLGHTKWIDEGGEMHKFGPA